MPNLTLIYIAGYNVQKNTGRNKATKEKAAALKKILGPEQFRFFSPAGAAVPFVTYLFMFFFDAYLFFRLFFLNRETIVIERQAFLPLTNTLLKWKGNKMISEVHADILLELPFLNKNRLEKKIIRVIEWFERYNLKLSAGIICIHPRRQALLQEKYRKPCTYIYNGANTQDFRPLDMQQCRLETQLEASATYFLFSGMVSKWHGVEYLIRIFNEAVLSSRTDHFLIILGTASDPYSHFLKTLAAPNPRILFIGHVPMQKVATYINAANICLLPMNDLEDSPRSPLKLYDYIACGKPVVAQEKLPGYSDEVLSYHLGCVTDFTAPESAAHLLTEFAKQADAEFYRQNNRTVAVEKVSWEQRMGKWIEFICSV